MASKAITLKVRPRGKPISKLPEEVTVPANCPGTELYDKLAQLSRFSVHRLRITKGSDGSSVPNAKGVTIHSTGLRDQSTVYVKDLGPQIAWRTVFIIEYLGPLLIHPLVYFMRPYIYPNAPSSPSQLQTLSCILISLHFLKRELETIFIHRFSLATMPAFNIFKNSAHYWLLAGLNIAFWIYRPAAPTAKDPPNPILLYTGLIMYVIGELGNLNSHLVLRGLRSTGGTERGIPTGLGFNLVTCPNYLFETIAWIGVLLVSGLSLSVVVFIIAAVGQMLQWAAKKEKRYRSEFGDKYKRKRYTMLPGIY